MTAPFPPDRRDDADAHRSKAKPPKLEIPPSHPNEPWGRGVGAFVAWGAQNPEDIVSRALRAKLRWVAVQACPQIPADTIDTYLPFRAAIFEPLRKAGVACGIWLRADQVTAGVTIDATTRWQPLDFLICDIEIPEVAEMLPWDLHYHFPQFPIGVSTTFPWQADPPDTAVWKQRAKPWIDIGAACLSQAYVNEGTQVTPMELDFAAYQCGWPDLPGRMGVRTYPTISLYEGRLGRVSADAQRNSLAAFKYRCSVYLLETATDDDLDEIGTWS